jgi:hypothetical protein
MNSIAPAFRFIHRSALRRSALGLVLALGTMLGDPAAGQADGPLTFRGSVPLGVRAHDIIVDGNTAFVATERGLTILDISNPVQPVVRSTEPSTNRNRSQGLARKGSYLYLAAGRVGVQIIDVSNLDDPRTIGHARQVGTVYDVAVHPTADAVYAITYNGELLVWDTTVPAAPVLKQMLGVQHWRGVCEICVERMRNLAPNGGAQAVGVSTAGNFVIATDWAYGGGYVWDSTDPYQLVFRGTHRAPVGFRSEIDLARDIVYILGTYASTSGVHTVPLSRLDPFVTSYPAYLPWPIGTPTCSNADGCDFMPSTVMPYGGGINFSGKYVFYAAPRGRGELAVVDATDPGNLVKVASTELGTTGIGTAQGTGVVSKGDIIYVAAGLQGVQFYEFPGLSNPAP